MHITNTGREVATNFSLRFKGSNFGYIGYYEKDGQRTAIRQLYQNNGVINLPDISQGETIDLNIVAESLDARDSLDKMEVYSSIGSADVRWRGEIDSEYSFIPSSHFGFFSYYKWQISTGVLAFFIFMFWSFMNSMENFWKLLLKDDDFYLEQKIRFDENPKKYSIPFGQIRRRFDR